MILISPPLWGVYNRKQLIFVMGSCFSFFLIFIFTNICYQDLAYVGIGIIVFIPSGIAFVSGINESVFKVINGT